MKSIGARLVAIVGALFVALSGVAFQGPLSYLRRKCFASHPDFVLRFL
jgi:hypothetical protein